MSVMCPPLRAKQNTLLGRPFRPVSCSMVWSLMEGYTDRRLAVRNRAHRGSHVGTALRAFATYGYLSPQRVAAFVESIQESQMLSPLVRAGLFCARSIQPRALS